MQHWRTKAVHEHGGPLDTPSHQVLPWRQKPKGPLCRAACQEAIWDSLESACRSSFRVWRLAVYSAL
jgi:hypothetical protein